MSYYNKNDLVFLRRPKKRRGKSSESVDDYLDWLEWRRLEHYRKHEDLRSETWRRRG